MDTIIYQVNCLIKQIDSINYLAYSFIEQLVNHYLFNCIFKQM